MSIDKIVDSHVHFWDTHLLDYDWLKQIPALNRPYLPTDLKQAIDGHPVRKKVFVQAGGASSQALAEVEWVSKLAEVDRSIQAIVAFAPLELGDRVAAFLTGLGRYPLVKGVRRLIQSEKSGFAQQPDFVRGVQMLTEHSFSFDICILHDQLADVLQLVQQCPDVQFVLDHIGKPAIKEGQIELWKRQIDQLAAFPNVTCKLSGLVTEADVSNWKAADLQPYIEHVLDAFGPGRLMFGSDWPVCTLASSYERWLATAYAATKHLSQQDRDNIFYYNASNFYQLTD